MHISTTSLLFLLAVSFPITSAWHTYSDFLYERSLGGSDDQCCPPDKTAVPDRGYAGILKGPCAGKKCVDSKTAPKAPPPMNCPPGSYPWKDGCKDAGLSDKAKQQDAMALKELGRVNKRGIGFPDQCTCPMGQTRVSDPMAGTGSDSICAGSRCVDSKTGKAPPPPKNKCPKGFIESQGACLNEKYARRWEAEAALEDGLYR